MNAATNVNVIEDKEAAMKEAAMKEATMKEATMYDITDMTHNSAVELDLDALHSDTVSHIIALKGGAMRLPKHVTGIRVISGSAWVSFGGHDFVVNTGKVFSVGGADDGVIVSPVRGGHTVIEIIV